jgi:LTXXQ motif family protein
MSSLIAVSRTLSAERVNRAASNHHSSTCRLHSCSADVRSRKTSHALRWTAGPINALSDEDIAALRNGEGMGMAKVAELYGYPGPARVLTLANELSLTESQRQQVRAIYDRMNATAKLLGGELIMREQALDQLFAKGEITPPSCADAAAIASLRGRLRSVHLAAHPETRALLSLDQIARYQQFQGYDNPAAPQQHHHG